MSCNYMTQAEAYETTMPLIKRWKNGRKRMIATNNQNAFHK